MTKGKKVYIAVYSGEDAGAALAKMMGQVWQAKTTIRRCAQLAQAE